MNKLSWLISLAISLFGFLIMGPLFTTTPEDGNGNLGFVGIIFLIPFLLLSIFITFLYFQVLTSNTTNFLYKILGIFGGVLLICVVVYLFNDYKSDVLQTLDSVPDSILFDLPKLNEDTYNIYFNFYTFTFIHSIFGLLGSIIGLFKPTAKKEELLD